MLTSKQYAGPIRPAYFYWLYSCIIKLMSIEIIVRPDIKLGVWQGMGGAITEAAAYNFAKLKPERKKALIEAYYGKDGIGYDWGRISIGSNDFCLEPFEYTKRTSLKDFSIEHDRKWLLPMMEMILAKKELKIVASPWSPPSCLKYTHMTRFGGNLKPWRYKRYAQYIRKWLDAYADEGIKVRYITPQNEPHAIQKWESCIFSYRGQRRLAYKCLADELADLDTQILLWDHNKKKFDRVAERLLNGKYVTKYGRDEKVCGLCYHWYNGTHPDKMWEVREKYPDIMTISSEMCCGWSPYNAKNWANAANPYYFEIFSDINCGASAWIDWNMLLGWDGGPSYCGNYCASPVILNETSDDFILTPIYDALKKFSKMFPAGSEVVRCENPSKEVAAVARKTKKGYTVVIANTSDEECAQEVTIRLGKTEKQLSLERLEIVSIDI